MTKKLFVICLALLLSACASNQAVLSNASGQQYQCSSQGFGVISSILANSKFSDCIATANAKGYK